MSFARVVPYVPGDTFPGDGPRIMLTCGACGTEWMWSEDTIANHRRLTGIARTHNTDWHGVTL